LFQAGRKDTKIVGWGSINIARGKRERGVGGFKGGGLGKKRGKGIDRFSGGTRFEESQFPEDLIKEPRPRLYPRKKEGDTYSFWGGGGVQEPDRDTKYPDIRSWGGKGWAYIGKNLSKEEGGEQCLQS